MPEVRLSMPPGMGLHARPAALFVRAAAATGQPVTIAKGSGPAVDARSILGVLALGVEAGDEVTLTCEDEESGDALAQLAALLTAPEAAGA